mmetsp:Transcript_40337/g.59282  ORF Transcript_40337/g.59282 Transcript_40337/m.59282 type:complete len:215 (+) Transcript_40337:613-1257(+)
METLSRQSRSFGARELATLYKRSRGSRRMIRAPFSRLSITSADDASSLTAKAYSGKRSSISFSFGAIFLCMSQSKTSGQRLRNFANALSSISRRLLLERLPPNSIFRNKTERVATVPERSLESNRGTRRATLSVPSATFGERMHSLSSFLPAFELIRLWTMDSFDIKAPYERNKDGAILFDSSRIDGSSSLSFSSRKSKIMSKSRSLFTIVSTL